MLDTIAVKILNKPLHLVAGLLKETGINKDVITLTGFVIGLFAIILIAFHFYTIALAFIAINRIFDGIDGALARLTKPTDSGGFLDITLDFIFYAGIVFAFALADPESNAIPACLLLFSFIGTGSSFLAFSVMAEKNGIKSMEYPNKSL
ncbi:MAG: CDP-alcohol phosphatidyltransferase family protein, partial [Desulfobacteraceae bacterium]|nr:CDP-alcohol phosphatidyltransferase family protein [Desulfobacteraceae bacterium]